MWSQWILLNLTPLAVFLLIIKNKFGIVNHAGKRYKNIKERAVRIEDEGNDHRTVYNGTTVTK